MRRTIINWFLLITIVAAAPDVRDKRHLSYIKDFILTLFQDDLTTKAPTPILETEQDYEFYRIPGYSDILIKTIKCNPEEVEIVDMPSEVEIRPFESYIGTKNIKETGAVFRNTYKLLSTGILYPPERNTLQKIMVPIINDLRYKDREGMKPEIRPDGIPFRSVIIKQGELKSIPAQNEFNSEKNIRPLSVIPRSRQPEIVDEINVNQIDHYLHETFDTINSPQELDNVKPVIDFSVDSYPEVRQNTATNMPKFIKQGIQEVISLENKGNRGREREKEYAVKQYIPIPIEPDNFENNLGRKVMPIVTYVVPSTFTEKSVKESVGKTVDIVETTSKPMMEDVNMTTFTPTSTDKTIHDTENDTTISQDNHTDSSKFQIAKEKDEINSQLPDNINVPLVGNKSNDEQKMNNSKPVRNKEERDGYNLIKSSDEFPISTLSQYIYEHLADNKSHPVNIQKEKDDILTHTLSPIADKTSLNVGIKDVDKTVNDIPRNKTLSQYIYNRTHPDAISKNKLHASFNNNSEDTKSLNYNVTKNNSEQKDVGNVKTKNVQENIVLTNHSQLNVVPKKDIVPKLSIDNKTETSKINKNGFQNEALPKTNNDYANDVTDDARIAQLIKILTIYNELKKLNVSSENQIKIDSPLGKDSVTISPLKNMINANNDQNRNDKKTNNDITSSTPSVTENIPAKSSPPVNNTSKSYDNENLDANSENVSYTSRTDLLEKVSATHDPTTVKEDADVQDDKNNNESSNNIRDSDSSSNNAHFETLKKGRGDIPDQ